MKVNIGYGILTLFNIEEQSSLQLILKLQKSTLKSIILVNLGFWKFCFCLNNLIHSRYTYIYNIHFYIANKDCMKATIWISNVMFLSSTKRTILWYIAYSGLVYLNYELPTFTSIFNFSYIRLSIAWNFIISFTFLIT